MIGDLEKLYRLLTPTERRRFLGVFVVMVFAATFQVIGIGSLHPFLQLVTEPQAAIEGGLLGAAYTTGGFDDINHFMIAFGGLVLILIVGSNATLLFSKYVQTRFQWGVNHSLSTRLLEEYLGRDYEYFLNHNTSEISKNILSEARQVSRDLVNPMLKMMSRGLIALFLVGLLFIVDPTSAAFILIFIGGGFGLAYIKIRKRLRTIGKEYVAANEDRYKAIQEAFGGIKEVKLNSREPHFLSAYESPSRGYSSNLATYRVYKLMPKYIIEALAFGGLMLLLLGMLLTGQGVASIVPLLGVFAFAGYRMMPAFRDILSGMASMRFNKEILGILDNELRESSYDPYDVDGGPTLNRQDPLPFESAVRYEDVTYTYPGADSPAVREVDIEIPKNSAVAFVGQTGAGKTTLVDLFLGLIEPSQGNLLVDGEPIHPERVGGWQRNLGYVPQSIYLADDTIRRNIAFGLPEDEIDNDRVKQAAKIAHIHGFIARELPDGYETTVGEGGVRLSGGQRQRIGIARALYNDPDVLVLDEATSDIDRNTESHITQAIEGLVGDKTVVTIAHRLSTVRECDCIFVVKGGDIMAEGTFDELLATSPLFRELTHDLGQPIKEASSPGS